MKNWGTVLLFTSFVMASASFAQAPRDLYLSKKKEAAQAASVVVVRDHRTPSKVKLTLDIPFDYRVCVRHETRMVYGQDSSCGYDTRYESHQVCSTQTTCTVRKNGVCKASTSSRSCHTERTPVTVMRSCYHPETYCAEYGTVTRREERTVKLKFNGLDDLKAGEEERFMIEGRQRRYDSSNADYAATVIDSIEPTEAQVKSFLGDRVVFKRTK